jgi:predicted  nucleic acid-binding Zn-ribbon protein
MENTYLINGVGVVVTGVLGFFLKDLHVRFKDMTSEVNRQHDNISRITAKVERVEEKLPSELANLEKIVDMRFHQFNIQFEELKRAINHAEKTMLANSEAFVKLLEEYSKSK